MSQQDVSRHLLDGCCKCRCANQVSKAHSASLSNFIAHCLVQHACAARDNQACWTSKPTSAESLKASKLLAKYSYLHVLQKHSLTACKQAVAKQREHSPDNRGPNSSQRWSTKQGDVLNAMTSSQARGYAACIQRTLFSMPACTTATVQYLE